MRLSICPWFFALVAIVAPASTSFAQGERIAQECVERIGEITQRAVVGIREEARNTARQIERLSNAGAADDQLKQAAREGTATIARMSRGASNVVGETADRCVHALRRLGADDSLIERVRRAQRNATSRIHSAAQSGRNVIAETLRDALGGG